MTDHALHPAPRTPGAPKPPPPPTQARIQPRAVTGTYTRRRWFMVWLTQLVYYGTPWLRWDDRQAVLFDVETPRFHLFGLVLQPQDLIFVVGLMVVLALTLFFFTAIAGRLWCGYSCPQTVYSSIFLWIEHRFEGDRPARLRLDRAPWTRDKLLRRGGKHLAWLLVALVFGITFVGYFEPIDVLARQVATVSPTPWTTFWILCCALGVYGNAGWLREQVCTFMCPYARLQSTMIDADSLVIAYDTGRGEPRGARSRKAASGDGGLGDCTDCGACVQVCPTGIDIRKGLQNECIACAACVDACDEVMDRMGYARGLIRYASANALAHGWTRARMMQRLRRPRVLIYGAALLVSVVGLVAAMALRTPVSMDVMRDRGIMARLGDEGRIENVYRVQLMDHSATDTDYVLSAEGLPGLTVDGGAVWSLPAGQVRPFTLRLSVPGDGPAAATPGTHAVTLRLSVRSGDGTVLRERTTFIVPR